MKSTLKPKPTVFMIFGGTGDLTERKLIPALFNLFLEKYMPKEFAIIGLGRTDYNDETFVKQLLNGVNTHSRSGKADKEKWAEFSSKISYLRTNVNNEKDYEKMSAVIENCEEKWSECPVVIHYLAVAPQFFPIIASNLAKVKLADDTDKTRIVIEKPFGRDLESAKELNNLLSSIFNENQIYRIDHYLGKETVQNMLAFRFANALFEPIWNRNYIEHVQISVTEDIGVEDRGGYYDSSGALRDMLQNHILQVLCLVGMEAPNSFDAEEIRNRKVDVLKAMRKFGPEEIRFNTVRGQYGEGWVKGEKVDGYRQEEGVDKESNTETFAAFKFFIDNWRWQNIPFYVRTGKRMHQKSSIISIQFKDVPHLIFPNQSSESWQQNRLIISIQPEMSIRLQVQAKRPGLDMTLNPVDMVFNYDGTYEQDTPEAYETLLLDAMKGDQTLFMRGDQVEIAWDILMPVIENWESKKSISFPNYSADSWGPETAEALIAKDGFHWFTLPIKKTEKK
jgi:glucose-6-phosphate 1-dehydrogenase